MMTMNNSSDATRNGLQMPADTGIRPELMRQASGGADDLRAILNARIASGCKQAIEVATMVERDVPTDQIAAVGRITVAASERGQGLHFHLPGNAELYSVSRYAVEQVASKAGIPTKYLRALLEGGDGEAEGPKPAKPEMWGRRLAAHALNEHFGHSDARVLLRSVRGELRGVLSDSYRRIDVRPVFDALMAEANDLGAVPVDGTCTEVRTSIKLVYPQIFEPIPGEFVVYGIEWSNSDYGAGSNNVRVFALRVRCLNGLVAENLLRQIHLGKKLPDDVVFSQRTYELDTAASVSAMRDMVRACLSEGGRDKISARIRAAHDQAYSAEQLAAVVKDQPKTRVAQIVESFKGPDVVNLPAGNTAWRASNAISWIARQVEATDARLELERAAGALV